MRVTNNMVHTAACAHLREQWLRHGNHGDGITYARVDHPSATELAAMRAALEAVLQKQKLPS